MKPDKVLFHPIKLIRNNWFQIAGLLLAISIVLVIAEWFMPIPPDLSAGVLTLTFMAYLLSEKICGYPIPLERKAFCYFAGYLNLYLILDRHLRARTPRISIVGILIFACIFFVSLIFFQAKRFYFKANVRTVRKWIFMWALISVVCLSSTMLLTLGSLWKSQ